MKSPQHRKHDYSSQDEEHEYRHHSRSHHHHHHHHRHHHHHHHGSSHSRGSSHGHSSENSGSNGAVQASQAPHPFKGKNFKLLVDPVIVKGAVKLYRFDGVVPGDSSCNITVLKDPRPSLTRIWTRLEVMDLSVPRFKIDSNYVGEPPGIEVTISNLNDNVDKQFLLELVSKYGEVEDIVIYYHPVTHKHLGIARVVFFEREGASSCVSGLNMRPVMGKQIAVYLDPFGKSCKSYVEEVTGEKKSQPLDPAENAGDSDANQSVEKGDDESVHALPDGEKSLSPKNSEALTGSTRRKKRYNDEDSIPSGTRKVEMPVNRTGVEEDFRIATNHETPSHMNPLNSCSPYGQYAPSPALNGVPFPNAFNTPPPQVMGPGPPMWSPPNWEPNNSPWTQANPQQWNHNPQYMTPPPRLPEPPPHVTPPTGTLDLDTRIELLLKGMNGKTPPFLAMDMEEENSSKPVKTSVTESRRSSVSSEEAYSPPPLPPGEETAPLVTASPSSPSSFYSPKSSPFPELDTEKYLPLSTPPSPFLSEEEYLESLLSLRLKHLALVKQREKDSHRKKRFLIDTDKVSEISSDEAESDFVQADQNGRDDDQMSLSSLSSNGEKIEEVTVPSNPYGSFTFGDPTPTNDSSQCASDYHAPSHPSYLWEDFMNPRYPTPVHKYPIPHGPGQFRPFTPSHLPPVLNSRPPERRISEEVENNADPVELALENVSNVVKKTLEKDLFKRMTQGLAFNELELWWDSEEKIHKEKYSEPGQDKDSSAGKLEKEEKRATTECLLNAIIDSNYEAAFMPNSSFGLGFRATLPKMPSFKRKMDPSDIRKGDNELINKEEPNESDEEEMVQLSDDDDEHSNEPDSSPVKERRERRSKRDEADSSDNSDSESSDSSSSEDDQSSSESSDGYDETAKNDLIDSIDYELLERMRSKTPEGRNTPIPTSCVSDDDEDDFSIPPKTPDIHLSDTELPRTPSPNGPRDKRTTAMEALMALGLDEFVCDIKIREDPIKTKPFRIRTPSPTIPLTTSKSHDESVTKTKKTSRHKDKEKVKVKDRDRDVKVEETSKPSPKKTEEVEKPSSADDSDSTMSTEESIIAIEHSYSLPKEPAATPIPSWALDHDYSNQGSPKWSSKEFKTSTSKERKKTSEKLVSHLFDAYLKRPPREPKVYDPRDSHSEMIICYDFLTKGADNEDIMYLKRTYESMLADETQSYWLNDTHWVNHTASVTPSVSSKRQKMHASGCARAEGFYKLDPLDKQRHRHHYNKAKQGASNVVRGIHPAAEPKGWTAASREARSNQRRLLTAFGTDTDSDLLKFNQLKFRKKQLKFSKSEIHDWGLFAMEPIAADEMVIEYVGQMVRPFVADFREKGYEKRGIGSSYLFRIDLETIVDATKCGNLARFINHSCNPNCYAKIITIEGQKKIVIYSKKDIKVNEEITYDYKFPLEEEKIRCLCFTPQCKGFLN